MTDNSLKTKSAAHEPTDSGADAASASYGKRNPVKLLLVVASAVFVGEALVMGFLSLLPPLSPVAEAILDALLLVALVFPVLYYVVLQQLIAHIRARDAAQEKLKRYSLDLKAVNDDIRSFAYIVSHDLRAPLVSIRGFSSELDISCREISARIDKYLPAMEEKDRKSIELLIRRDIAESLQFIASSVNRMDSLINSILTLSRVGRRVLKPEQLNMRALVQGIINSLAHQIESRGVTVKIGELADLVADRTAVEQIFGNLLDNAVKYLEPGRAGEIEVAGTLHADEAVYHIRDNGRGMDNEDIPKAFEIFRRVGKQDVPGEGMGLAYVKALVRHLGGRIWCESKLGEGSVFSLTIPLLNGIERNDTPGATARKE